MTCIMPLPGAVTVTDITCRDGFQNIKTWIPTETKQAVLDKLAASGVASMEITSFVSPKAIPQMADAAEVLAYMLERHPEVTAVCLTPNLRGAERAAACGATHISYIISASASHNKANINRSHEESLADLEAVIKACPNLSVTLSMPTAFGCPFEGEVPFERVLWLTGEVLARGAAAVTLCDTIGVANPLQVKILLEKIGEKYPAADIGVHMHDTHGMGLANTMAALESGITRFETAAGGLGGCPFAPGAAGNTATEDTLNMVQRMGIATGIDLGKYLEAVAEVRARVEAPLPGHLASARTYAELSFFSPAKL